MDTSRSISKSDPKVGWNRYANDYVDAIGTLMTETYLSEILKSVFGGVKKC